jgi:hypothetical protein
VVRIHSPRPIHIIRWWPEKQPHPVAHPYVYYGHGGSHHHGSVFRPSVVRNLGRQLPRTAAPEGWLRRIDRRRVGTVWVGFFYLWTSDANGRRLLRCQNIKRSKS